MSHDHSHHAAPSCECCEHSHAESALPQTALVAASGALTGIGLLIHWILPAAERSAMLAFAAATVAGGLLVFPAAWGAIRKWRLDINVLMAVAVIGAWAIRQGAEAASVVFLFSLSELLEGWAGGRARKAVDSLLELSPATAIVGNGSGGEREVPVSEVAVDTEILIRSGSRVPLDGVVIAGHSTVDQAPITGESIPVEKESGDPVYAGTINGEGSLTVRVTKPAADSTLSQIVRLVGEAEAEKPPSQRYIDRFATIYTPAVFVIAVLVALVPPLLFHAPWGYWFYRSLVLLVIACPCALVIATPVSIVSGLTTLARRGVLVKGGTHLEAVGKLRALALDKTGTITAGKPRVVEIISLCALSQDEILARAASINAHSAHPLAVAIVDAANERGLAIPTSENYASVTGRGARADIAAHPHFIGNHKLTHETGLCGPDVEARLSAIEKRGQSLAVVGHSPHEGCPGEILGIVAIADTVRPEVADALRQIHAAGVRKIVMLSGDNQRTASAIAAEVGIDEAVGDLMPQDKVTYVRKLTEEFGLVGMIGDGVNDAPALAVATVGFAMGAIGSDTAIETADIALMKDDLRRVAETIVLGRRTLSIIRFNVLFALGIKAVVLGFAFLGEVHLWLAILADTGATLLVILNSLRLLRGPRAR